MKSLAIDYKENKDKEINELTSKINEFKKTIEESNEVYESMLDRTTKSLEKIIEKSGANPKIQ